MLSMQSRNATLGGAACRPVAAKPMTMQKARILERFIIFPPREGKRQNAGRRDTGMYEAPGGFSLSLS
jgi:hypothetical protein